MSNLTGVIIGRLADIADGNLFITGAIVLIASAFFFHAIIIRDWREVGQISAFSACIVALTAILIIYR